MRLRVLPALMALVCLFWPAAAEEAKARTAGAPARPPKRPLHKTRSAVRKKAPARSRGKTRRARRTTQTAPTPERYQEIQQALAGRGYSGGPANGAWGPQWAEALKRFQHDQKLEPSGKLTSLSLLALGLGPKRDAAGAPMPAARPHPPSDSPARELP
jgi:peptidoglycan hydrolase-like protein with peptidoglycan-binding domain